MAADRPMMAAGIIIVAMFLLGFFDNLVRQIVPDVGLWQFHLFRSIMAICVLTLLAALGMADLRAHRLWAVMVRGGFAALSMLIYFGCLGFLPVGQVAAGLFTAPIWVMLISAVFLGRPIGATRMAAALIGFVGVLIVLNPFADGVRLLALVPMIAGILYAIGGIATRQWCEGESAVAMLFCFFLWLGVFGLIGSLILTLGAGAGDQSDPGYLLRGLVWPTGWSWILMLAQAFGSLLGVGLLFRAYQLADAGQVSVYEYSLLPFAAVWSLVMYDEPIRFAAIFGMALIVLSGVVITLRSREG